MINKTKYRNKPLYKKFNRLKKNIQNRQKLLKFKKQKWNSLLKQIRLINKFSKLRNSELNPKKFRRRNCFYKFFDQNSYQTPKFANYFSKSFKQALEINKSLKLFYGNLGKKYLKGIAVKSKILASQCKNKFNSVIFFNEALESRLDVSLLRSQLVLSMMNARQLISHGHVFVNCEKVTKQSFLLKKGDIITFSKKSHKLIDYYINTTKIWRSKGKDLPILPIPPYYFQISYKIFQIIVVEDIKFANSSINFNAPMKWQNVLRSHLQ